MAKPPRLKVFRMPAGFFDAVVAVPSRAAALRAWGTKTDLFAAGRAAEVDDEAIRQEALARPGEVIRKARGDEAAMLGPEPAEAFEPRRPTSAPAGKRARPPRAPKPKPPPPDRSELDAAERALAEVEIAVSAEMESFAAERAALDRRQGESAAEGERRVKAARRAVEKAAAAFERAVAANDNRA